MARHDAELLTVRWRLVIVAALLLAATIVPGLAWWPRGSGANGEQAPTVSNVQISSNNGTAVGAGLTGSGTVTGIPTPTRTYAWKTGSTVLGTGSTYTVQSSDVGHTITFTLTASNGIGSPASSTSAPFGPITLPPTVQNVAIAGPVTVGGTLTASATVAGSPTPTLSYLWKSGGVITGMNSASYVTVAQDVGNTITVQVTATSSSGTASATSPLFGPITSGAYTITSISLSSTTTTGAANSQVGCVSVTTSPPNHSWTGPVTLSGTNAPNYVLTNQGNNPTCLNVGTNTINGGNPETDNITLTVTQ